MAGRRKETEESTVDPKDQETVEPDAFDAKGRIEALETKNQSLETELAEQKKNYGKKVGIVSDEMNVERPEEKALSKEDIAPSTAVKGEYSCGDCDAEVVEGQTICKKCGAELEW